MRHSIANTKVSKLGVTSILLFVISPLLLAVRFPMAEVIAASSLWFSLLFSILAAWKGSKWWLAAATLCVMMVALDFLLVAGTP